MLNRVKLLRLLTTVVFSIATLASMVPSASADVTPTGALGSIQSLVTGTTNSYDQSTPPIPQQIFVGDTVYIYGAITYNSAGTAPVADTTLTVASNPTATFTFVGVGTTLNDCRPTSGGGVPTLPQTAPPVGTGLVQPIFCWYSTDLQGGDNDITVDFFGNASFGARSATSTITLNKPTPKVVISTVVNQYEENRDPSPAPSPSDSSPAALPQPTSMPSPDASHSSNATPQPYPHPTTPGATQNANTYANKGDTVDVTATVSFSAGTKTPTGTVFFYEQDPVYSDLGKPISDTTGNNWGCVLSTIDSTSSSCTMTINASDLTYFSANAVGTHGLVGVYVGTQLTDIPAPYIADPATAYEYSVTQKLHGGSNPDLPAPGLGLTSKVSFMDNSHFDSSTELKFDTISGDSSIGDTNFTGAVSGYNNGSDLFETGPAFLINIYRGWAHVWATATPIESTQYGETVTFNVAVIGDASVGTNLTTTPGGLGIRLTDSNYPNAPPIYLYCEDGDSLDLTPAIGNGCTITTDLLHPLESYIVDAFFMGNADYLPTTYMGYDVNNPVYLGERSLADYLYTYFDAYAGTEAVNPGTTHLEFNDQNNYQWSIFSYSGITQNDLYFFNDPDDYVYTAHVVVKADPVVEITEVSPEPSEYGEDVTFTVTVNNPNSTNTLLDYPTGDVTLTSDAQEDWSVDCTFVSNSETEVTATYTCHSEKLLAGDHVITASYAGDSNYNEAVNATEVTHTVNKVAPVIEITSDPSTTEYGEMATFTVTITNPYNADPYNAQDLESPTGEVYLTSDNLDQDWRADCSVDSTDAGTTTYVCESPTLLVFDPTIALFHTLTVHYAGDDNYLADDSVTYEYVVTPYTPEVTIESNPETTQYGETVTFTVHVSGTDNEGVEAPRGTVVLTSSEQEGWSIECTNDVYDASTYTCAGVSAILLKDVHTIVATFTTEDGAVNYLGYNYTNAEGELEYSVDYVTPTIDFIANQDSTEYGQSASFTVTLDNPNNLDASIEGLVAPTGDVTLTSEFQSDWSAECTVDSTTGSQSVYTCESTTLLAGEHTLVASYEGDENYTSNETTIVYTVNKVNPVVEITADPETTKYGENATFTVTVANPYDPEGLVAPTGDMTLTSDIQDWTAYCTFEESDEATSTYTCESPTLIAGEHTLTVHYVGDDNYNSSDETTLTYTVEKYTPEVTITTDVETTQYGEQVTFTVTLEGTGNEGVDAPSGTVVLTSSEQSDWELSCENVTTDGSTYTCFGTSATLLADTHDIIATFTPDDTTLGNNYTEVSDEISYEVTKQDPLPTITANPADSNTYGSTTTFTVTLSGTDFVDSPSTGADVLAPTGEVTLTDSENADWVVDCVASGLGVQGGATFTCSGSSPTLSVGTHVITASYEGDDNYESTSVAIETYEILKYTPSITVEVDSEPAVYGDEQTITVIIAGSGNADVTPPSAQTITLNDPASNWSYTGVPSCETNDETITLTCTVTTTHLFAGQYPIHATYAGDDNYNFNEGTSEASVEISKAVLEVTPAESLVSIDYGATTIPALTARIEGFKNNEDASSFVPNQATSFANEDGTENTVAGSDWFLAPTCAPVNLYLPSGEMVDAGTSGVYYNCSGGSADNYTFEHSGNAAVTIRQTTAQLQITSNVLTATYGQKIDFTVHLVNNSGIAVDAVSIQISSGDVILGNCTLGDLSRNKCGITSDVLQVGDNTVTASWNGPADVNFAVPTPATMHQPVVKAGVGITVTSNHNPANPSQSIILTATVTGTSTPPTGSVTFVGGINEVVAECSPVIGTNRSVCDAEVGTLNPDVYHVEVSYSGDDNYEGNGTTYIQIVQFASTGVNIAPANETSTYGDSVEFTVTVPGDAEQNPTAWPTGRVTITDNNRVYSVGCDLVHIPESVDSSCVITVTGMELGQHQILASYAGDSIFPSSNDLTGHHVVIDTTTSISSSKNAANVGDSVTLTATVSSVRGTPTSSVISFREDGNEIASCNIYGGTCSVTFAYSSAFTGGLHNIVAVFLPGEASDFRTSTSGILEQQINELIATVTLTQSTETSFVGQRTNFTVSVAGSANIPTGSVRIDIKANETVVESLTCTLTNGLCSAGTSTLAAGTYSVTATYLGEETGYPSATSDAITHAVVLKGTSVSISSSKNPSLYGDTITLTSTVTSEHGIPSSGSIRFESDGNEIATCNVSGGTCSITTNALAIGSHEVIAYFIPTEGSAFEAANSPTLTQDVQALQVIAVTVTSNLNPSLVGQIVTFTVNVTGNGYLPKGPASIDVVDRGTGLLYETLDCVVVNGRCSVSTSDLEAGEYDVTAHYQGDASLGDAGYPAADSDSEAILKQVVNEPSLLVTSRESETHHTNLPTGDSLITLSVAISGNAGPITGTVSFYLDGAIEDTVFAHAQYIGTGTCTRQRLTNPVSYTANCQIKVLASVLHALNPTVRNHYVTVSYNGSTYGSVSVLRDGSGVSSVLHEIANAVADNHTVTFDKNAADAVDPTPEASDTQTANATTVLTPNSYTRAGYTFDGWASSSDGVVIYAPGTTYPFTEDTTLFAHWTANPSAPVLADHTVTFDKNAADATGATPNQTTNTPTALTLNGFTRDGYTFAGWTTNADGTGDSYLNGATYSFTADKTMFAKWTLNGAASHTVIFNPNAMVPGSTPNQSASSPTALTLNGFTRSGYTFDGWATSSLGAVVYANGATYSFDADITLFAHWTVIAAANHTVNFNGNSVDSLGSMTPQTSNSFTQLTANSFSRAGYVFDGWASTPSGALAFNNQASYSFASDTTLYARWAIDNHTVTFDGNGATSGSMSPQVSNVPTVLTVNAFSRTNFTFDGWATSAGGAVVYAPGIYGFAADITLFAKWSANYVAPAPAPYVPPTPSQTTPILAWANPASIVVGTALSATQLNATVVSPAGLSGTFSYSPALASLLAAGTYTLTVTFTPTDTTNYTVATKTVTQIVTPLGTTPVGPGTPTAATINLGDGSGTYDTTGHEAPVSISPANCTYTVTYNGSTTVPVNAGSYNVIVTATGNCTGTATRTLVIAKATPNVDWLDPADITTTTPLGSNELNATADVPGKFAYSPAAKRLLPAGTQTLNATFTPTDSANYESVNITASINVTAAILSQTLVSFFSLASSTIPADQLLIISAASITPGQQIVITGYAQPSKSAAADLKLGLARANAVKAQILKKNPKAKITVKTLGAKYQPLCAAAKNKCVVVVLK